MIIASTIITLFVTILLMLALRPLALEFGLVDRPGGRKHHVGEVPIIGGAAMFIGIAIGIALLPDFGGGGNLLLIAGGLLVSIGLIDDRFALPASVRLIAQIVVVLIMVYGADLIMRDIGDPLWIGRINLGPLALVVTALIFVSTINAFNLIDGLDGLAGSMVLTALLAIAIVAEPGSPTQLLAGIVSAAVIGYLAFNLPLGEDRPWRAFMGDAGATLLGMTIVWLTVGISQGPDRVISPVNGLWFVALPIYDLFTCFVRRLLDGKSPFHPGRDHFHHSLRAAGMSVRRVVATLVALQVLYASFGIVSAEAGMHESVVFSIWAVVGIGQLPLVRGIGRLHRLLFHESTV